MNQFIHFNGSLYNADLVRSIEPALQLGPGDSHYWLEMSLSDSTKLSWGFDTVEARQSAFDELKLALT